MDSVPKFVWYVGEHTRQSVAEFLQSIGLNGTVQEASGVWGDAQEMACVITHIKTGDSDLELEEAEQIRDQLKDRFGQEEVLLEVTDTGIA